MWYKVKLLEKNKLARDTLAFCVEKPRGFKFIAGQYIGIYIPKLTKPDPISHLKSFSIASSPKERTLTLVMRMRDTGFKQALKKIRLGSYINIEGPYGQFTLHENVARPAIFIAGGVGVAPVRGIIKDVMERGLRYKVVLLYSDKTLDTMAYLDDLKEWQKRNSDFHLQVTLTGKDLRQWSGKTGRIDKKFIQTYSRGFKGPVYYLVGSEDFVYSMKQILKKSTVPEADIKTEEFAGY